MEKLKKFKVLNSFQLKSFAMFFMFLDHSYHTLFSNAKWLNVVGRLAFPIFAFQLVEGFYQSSDRKKYLKRLLIFAVISEIPFDLMCYATAFYPFHQNVMWTLSLGLLLMMAVEKAKNGWKSMIIAVGSFCVIYLASIIFMVDYNSLGILTILLFYFCHKLPGKCRWICQLVGLIYLNEFYYKGFYYDFSVFGVNFEMNLQTFCVFSLLFIWLYNGQKGKVSKKMQIFSYAFYPLHLILLYGLYRVFI